ncbi:Zinc finger, GRF-type [Spatholobus suberectus]|nr:Zinc finger, GRF-type [Spatholobus suberectus]
MGYYLLMWRYLETCGGTTHFPCHSDYSDDEHCLLSGRWVVVRNNRKEEIKRKASVSHGESATSRANRWACNWCNIKYCYCGRRVAIRTSKTTKNLGKLFYTCLLPKVHGTI